MADLDCGIFPNNFYNSQAKKISLSTENRVNEALTKILDVSYSFSDDTILDKLYSHLSGKSKEVEFVNRDDLLIPWLATVVKEWEKLKENIRAFALKMAGIVSTSSDGLSRIIENKILIHISTLAKCNESNVSITLALVEMLSDVVNHLEGCVWVLNSDFWNYILKLHHSSRSIYITRKTKELIINLILTLHRSNELESCWLVIDGILAPLEIKKLEKEPPLSRKEMLLSAQNFIFPMVDSPDAYKSFIPKCEKYEDNELMSKKQMEAGYDSEKIVTTVQLLIALMKELIENNCSAHHINKIFKKYNLYLWAWETLYTEYRDIKVIRNLSLLITYINFSTIPSNDNKKVSEADLIDTLNGLLYLVQSLTYKRQFLIINSVCMQSQMLTSKLISTPTYLCKEDGVTYNFMSQILFLHALPIFIFVKLARITHTDVTDKFADKLFTLTSMQVKRVCYQYRETLRVCPDCNNTELWLRSSIQTLVGLLKYLHKDQVVIIFQSLMHLFREFVPDEHTNMTETVPIEEFELVKKYPNLLMDILDGIEITIKNYNITWSESLETSCVLVLLMSVSCISNLTIPLATKLLKIMRIAISVFLPPNLALLVENFKDSSIEQLGPLLLRKLHDIHWEIRDSALEILQTLASLSVLKFPAFQNILRELNFPSIVLGMVECDEESYVRASAIICLQKMVEVKKLWEDALSDKNLLEKMLECLKTEPEGIVRKEAVCLITAIFSNHDIKDPVKEKIYKQLVYSATCDLHWEVKVNALSFWDAVIEHETAYQGMIDGAFPAVTFSTTTRKIVTLTPTEIQKRLKSVLDELQKNGCLQVLWTALNDMSDLEVARESVSIINKLLQLLQRYGVVEETCGRATVLPPLPVQICSFFNSNEHSIKKINNSNSNNEENLKKTVLQDDINNCANTKDLSASEDVIKSIMNSQDIELLSSVYCPDKTSTNYEESKCEGFERFITINEFIESVSSLNLECILKVRSEWLKASDELDSLIDDILAVVISDDDAIGDNRINAKDCY